MEAYTIDKFDWERFREQGHKAVDCLDTVQTVAKTLNIGLRTTREPDEIVTEEFIDAFQLDSSGLTDFPLETETAVYRCEITRHDDTYEATLEIDTPEVPDVVVFSGPIEQFRETVARDRVDYAFDIHRRAMKRAADTLLSERAVEVLLIETELDTSADEILDVSPSTVRTHRQRINEAAEDAESQLDRASNTLDFLDSFGTN